MIGEIYYTWIENGEWIKVKSSCEDLTKLEILNPKSETNPNDQNSNDQNLEQPSTEPPAEQPSTTEPLTKTLQTEQATQTE